LTVFDLEKVEELLADRLAEKVDDIIGEKLEPEIGAAVEEHLYFRYRNFRSVLMKRKGGKYVHEKMVKSIYGCGVKQLCDFILLLLNKKKLSILHTLFGDIVMHNEEN
jgi:hypothetical protein